MQAHGNPCKPLQAHTSPYMCIPCAAMHLGASMRKTLPCNFALPLCHPAPQHPCTASRHKSFPPEWLDDKLPATGNCAEVPSCVKLGGFTWVQGPSARCVPAGCLSARASWRQATPLTSHTLRSSTTPNLYRWACMRRMGHAHEAYAHGRMGRMGGKKETGLVAICAKLLLLSWLFLSAVVGQQCVLCAHHCACDLRG